MQGRIRSKPLTRRRRARRLVLATLVTGVVVSGCGGSSPSPTRSASNEASHGAATAAGATVGGGLTRSGSGDSGVGLSALAFSKCMRANGVPNFPDPPPGGGFVFRVSAAFNPDAPAVRAAQTKCQKLMPNPRSGGPAFSAQSLAKVVKVAECMRRHGISEFPDPTTSSPNFDPGVREITDYDGAYLAFPTTLDMESPAYKKAAAACGSLAERLGFGPGH